MFGRNRQDRLFSRFASGGDVRALGEVFDTTAPELLRIAAHVGGGRERARDLVQEAFLIAIEKRREFAAERQVLPWLCGIVVNLARNARRREQRELAPAPRAGAEDPVAAAEASEFRAALAQAKEELSAVYRPVLELHLEHGLGAAEIGSALGRPAGTVRTQLVRGLELLRRRLPQGFVAGLAVATFDAAALRAMRAAVVRRAAEVVPAAGGVAAGAGVSLVVIGAGAMQKKLVVVVAIAVLLALGFWGAAALPGPGDEGLAPVHERPEFVVTAPMEEQRGGVGAPSPASSSRAEAPLRDPAPSVAAAATGSLEVVARWRSDDAPAQALAITVLASDALGELDGRSVVTDGAGRALFAALPPGAVLVQASTGVRGEAEVVAGKQTTVTLGLDGVAVHGQVVDHRGEPVAGADVWVSSDVVYTRVRTGDRPFHGQYGQHTLRTDEQGRFVTRMTGRQCVAAFKPGHGPSLTQYPLVGKSRAGRGPIEVVLPLLPAGGTLLVVVHGKDAVPLAGALVLAGHEVPHLTSIEEQRATTPAQRAATGANGAATLTPLPTGRIPVQVRAAGHGPWQGEVDVVAGVTTSLDVALVDGGVVTGVVLDGTGSPLAGALVHHGTPAAFLSALAMSDANGAYRLEHLPDGEPTLTAFHEDWGRVTKTLVVTAGATSRWDARLPPRAAITGRVLDADGLPVGDCYVVAFAGERGRNATTRADAAGRFTLSPLDVGQQYSVTAEVQLRGGGISRPRREGVPAGTHVELCVDHVPTARLRGRVLQPDGRPAVGCEVNASTVGESIGSRHPVAEDGTFELGPFLARRVRLSVHRAGAHRNALGDFGVHEMRDGATTDVGDLVLSATGSMRLRVAPAERAFASLFCNGRHVEQRRVDAAAEVVWDELPPGQYAVCVTRGGAAPLCGFTEMDVHAGRRADVTVAVAPATLRDVGLGRPPRPPAEAKAPSTIVMAGGPAYLLRATDAGGSTVMMMWTQSEPDGSATRVVLPDSAATLSAICDDGRHGSVPTAAAPGEPLVIPLPRK